MRSLKITLRQLFRLIKMVYLESLTRVFIVPFIREIMKVDFVCIGLRVKSFPNLCYNSSQQIYFFFKLSGVLEFVKIHEFKMLELGFSVYAGSITS